MEELDDEVKLVSFNFGFVCNKRILLSQVKVSWLLQEEVMALDDSEEEEEEEDEGEEIDMGSDLEENREEGKLVIAAAHI